MGSSVMGHAARTGDKALRCLDCHDPHGQTKNPCMVRDSLTVDGKAVGGLKIEDNTFCLACHPKEFPDKAAILKHVGHGDKYDPANADETHAVGRCVACHMAKLATNGTPYDISSHAVLPVIPQSTIEFKDKGGAPNSCAASCHRQLAIAAGKGPGSDDKDLTNWAEKSDIDLAEHLVKEYKGVLKKEAGGK